MSNTYYTCTNYGFIIYTQVRMYMYDIHTNDTRTCKPNDKGPSDAAGLPKPRERHGPQ